MNCKPGDLARIVVPAGFSRALHGRLVLVLPDDCGMDDLACAYARVSQVADQRLKAWIWRCRFLPAFEFQKNLMLHKTFLLDAWLRPIRDPGEDAQDETLLWLPVPRVSEATA